VAAVVSSVTAYARAFWPSTSLFDSMRRFDWLPLFAVIPVSRQVATQVRKQQGVTAIQFCLEDNMFLHGAYVTCPTKLKPGTQQHAR